MEQSHSGFMAPLLYHAKKVLFPDALSADPTAPPHFRGMDTAPAVQPTKNATKFKRNEKSRRGRSNAANCSLAAVSTDVTTSRSTKQSVGDHQKENRIPFGRSNNNRRGAFRKKMDSLASASDVEGTLGCGGNGGVRGRRDDWSSVGSVFSTSSLAKPLHIDIEVRVSDMGNAAKPPQQQFDAQMDSTNSHQSSSNENISSAIRRDLSRSRDIDTSILSSIHESKKERRNRRRGRCKHPVSSLVQDVVAESNSTDNCKRATSVSSLMNLSSSIQKPHQRPSSACAPAAICRHHINPPSSQGHEDGLIHNIQSMTLDDGLKSPSKLQILQSQASHSSPSFHSPIVNKQRPFATAGKCTSPPDALHRLASVSNNIFQKAVTSNTPASKASRDYTPGSSARPVRKRMDKKKTPDKLTDMKECDIVDVMSPMAASPLVTEFSITPKSLVRRQRPIETSDDITERENAPGGADHGQDCVISFECVEDPEEISHAGISPQNLLTSPLNEYGAPELGAVRLACAKANLFSDGDEADTLQSNVLSDSLVAKTKVIRGSAVIAVEMPTPRFLKSKSPVEDSELDANSSKVSIRGSAVLSVQKAPPLLKTTMSLQTEHVESAAEVTKKMKTKKEKRARNKPMALKSIEDEGKSVPQETKQNIMVGGGMRRSARESKPTDRLTFDAWTDNDREVASTKVRFNNKDDDDLSTDGLDGEDASDPTSPLSEHCEKTETHGLCGDNHDIIPLSTKENMGANQSLSCSPTDGQWSSEEVSMLRNAQNRIDPTLSSYWEEVASLLGDKSASECREKWFSLVATPKVRPQNGAKRDQLLLSKSNCEPVNDASLFDEEDDLFQSTPWRGSLLDVQNDTLTRNLSQSSVFGASFGLSPCLQSASVKNSFLQEQDKSALKDRRKGYKTYIDNLRKDLNSMHKNKKNGKTLQAMNSQSSVHLECGVWGKLMANGSLHLSVQEESEEELDDFFDEEEED